MGHVNVHVHLRGTLMLRVILTFMLTGVGWGGMGQNGNNCLPYVAQFHASKTYPKRRRCAHPRSKTHGCEKPCYHVFAALFWTLAPIVCVCVREMCTFYVFEQTKHQTMQKPETTKH